MMRDSVVIYKSFHDASKALSPEEYKELWTKLFEYALEDIEPEALQGPLAQAILTMAKPQIDANKKKHDDGCKGGAPKGNQNARKQPKQPPVELENNHRLKNKQPNENENENVNVNVNEKINEPAPAQKKTFGEYKHVKMTLEEYERLTEFCGEAKRDAAIQFLDEYIEDKKYKSKSHYLAIRRWVLDALDEKARKGSAQVVKPKSFNTGFETRDDYDFDKLEAALLTRCGK